MKPPEEVKHKKQYSPKELDRITFAPEKMGGRACIRGKRVTVSLIVNLSANGMTMEEIVQAYPYLEEEDVRQALQYAAWLASESTPPIASTPTS